MKVHKDEDFRQASQFGVRRGLYYRCIGGDFIFLDLVSDRYFLLRDRPAECFARYVAGEPEPSDLDWLTERDILAPERASHKPEPIPPARSSLLNAALPRGKFSTTVASICAQRRARVDIKRRRMLEIVDDLAAAQVSTRGISMTACRDVAAGFVRARRYAPAIDQCLVRGIAMRRLLMRRGCAASLVFGVTMPFAAHCWVQAGDVVLTDTLDFVLSFEPILAA
ncbi:lasso peptide biosynthesis B2 protein [Sphingopyxis sp. GW247-27LB]|jgi:hypothetical protein|uniref:lasso peptide biosynthesis B2 protein n=1 Tax=Sphingopyxis sp. GW247-27LB TaxID=2012632 RepID=UPI000BA68966|nr:lasso peptide biosynthesis B2 protein [Sphingopyxis sp. GW247-27LB]PAL24286.1 hypothetical protein CD928_05180 [Sphingopyxis sp. GW247-27LB]